MSSEKGDGFKAEAIGYRRRCLFFGRCLRQLLSIVARFALHTCSKAVSRCLQNTRELPAFASQLFLNGEGLGNNRLTFGSEVDKLHAAAGHDLIGPSVVTEGLW